MKNAAKCDMSCELQNSVNHRIFERKLQSWDSPMTTLPGVSVFYLEHLYLLIWELVLTVRVWLYEWISWKIVNFLLGVNICFTTHVFLWNSNKLCSCAPYLCLTSVVQDWCLFTSVHSLGLHVWLMDLSKISYMLFVNNEINTMYSCIWDDWCEWL